MHRVLRPERPAGVVGLLLGGRDDVGDAVTGGCPSRAARGAWREGIRARTAACRRRRSDLRRLLVGRAARWSDMCAARRGGQIRCCHFRQHRARRPCRRSLRARVDPKHRCVRRRLHPSARAGIGGRRLAGGRRGRPTPDHDSGLVGCRDRSLGRLCGRRRRRRGNRRRLRRPRRGRRGSRDHGLPGGDRASRRRGRRCGRRRGRRRGRCDRRRGCHGLRRGRRLRTRRGRRGPLRQQTERVDIALLVRGVPDTEMDARDRLLGRPARAHRPDRRALRDGLALRDADRPEVDERHGVAVLREDRDASAVRR